jgi:hypothetical protein
MNEIEGVAIIDMAGRFPGAQDLLAREAGDSIKPGAQAPGSNQKKPASP